MDTDELQAWLRLTLSPGVGPEASRQLLRTFGSPEAVFTQTAHSLAQVVSAKLVRALQQTPAALATQLQTTLAWLEAADDRQVVTLGDANYPADLLAIDDPPLMLYMLGSLATPAQAAINSEAVCLAVVGSRNPTPQGQANAFQFSKALAEAGLCVVSGLALGVDGAAHEGALAGGGYTVAVVGTGLDRVYPKKHLSLAHRIAQHGLLVSEFPLGTPPLMANFPRRNRIISGMSRAGTLVVEAALQSGSLITARLASEQGREVFAIPGSIHSPQSRGCHALIKQGAKLVELAQDILEELGPAYLPKPSLARPVANPLEHATAEHPLLQILGFDAVSLDALQARCGLDTPTLQAQLLDLELAGQVARLPGGTFQRLVLA